MAGKKFQDDELIEWLVKGGSCTGFARDRGVSSRNVRRRRQKLAAQGRLDEIGIKLNIPEGRKLGKVTAQYRADGTLIQHWSRINESESQETFLEAVKDATIPIPSDKIPPQLTLATNTDVIPWFNIGDAHLGMIAYANEVGQSFDIGTCVRDLSAAFKVMVDRASGFERCVIQDMGDFTHYENMAGKTDASGHDLDYDTRYGKMMRAYVDIMYFMIDYALKTFQNVDVIINQGNHSRTNDIAMAVHLRKAYSKTERVNILDNENIFIPYRMGNTFVMCHHSDKCKPTKLANVMATDFRQDWGETEYHYIDIGHVHHSMVVKEHPGCKVESFNQLATMDKYAHDGGWRSRSCLTTVLRSKTYGEVGRHTLPLEEVRDLVMGATAGTAANIRREVYSV